MTRKDFIHYLSEPEKLNGHSIVALEKLIREYPYFQTAHLLYLKNLHNLGSIDYEKHLGIASAHAPDRKILFNLIRKKKAIEVLPHSHDNVANTENMLMPEEKKSDEMFPLPEQVIVLKEMPITVQEKKKTEPEKTQTVKNEIFPEIVSSVSALGFTKEEKQSSADIPKGKRISAPGFYEQKFSFSEWIKNFPMQKTEPSWAEERKVVSKHKQEIVDRFILEQAAKIPAKSKAEFYSAEAMAKQSIEDDENFITETLAKIYLRQGNLKKALRAYEILLVKHPEKFPIFAPLLEKLKKLQEDQKNR